MVDVQHVGCCHWVTLGVDLSREHGVLWVSIEVVSKISSLWGKIKFLVFITGIVAIYGFVFVHLVLISIDDEDAIVVWTIAI